MIFLDICSTQPINNEVDYNDGDCRTVADEEPPEIEVEFMDPKFYRGKMIITHGNYKIVRSRSQSIRIC